MPPQSGRGYEEHCWARLTLSVQAAGLLKRVACHIIASSSSARLLSEHVCLLFVLQDWTPWCNLAAGLRFVGRDHVQIHRTVLMLNWAIDSVLSLKRRMQTASDLRLVFLSVCCYVTHRRRAHSMLRACSLICFNLRLEIHDKACSCIFVQQFHPNVYPASVTR